MVQAQNTIPASGISSATLEADKKVEAALALHHAGNIKQAQAIYEGVLSTHPSHFSATQLLGMAHVQSGQHLKGIEYLSQAIQLNPAFAPCYINRGIALHSLGRFSEALNSYDEAIRIDPGSDKAYSNRGLALKELNRFEEAISSFDKAIQINPRYADAFSNRGTAFHAMERYQEALANYDRAISLKPNYTEAFLNRGNAYSALKQQEEALLSYEQAIRCKPDYAELYYSMGFVNQELRHYGQALACYDKAIALKPNYADAFLNRGGVLQKLKRTEEAIASYNAVIQINPQYVKAYGNRGMLFKELKRYGEALESFNRAIAIDPKFTGAYSSRGLMLSELKHFDEAIADYDTVIKLKPDDAQAHYDRGCVLYEQSKYAEAIAGYRQALLLNPEHLPAKSNILFTQSYTGISDPLSILADSRTWEKEMLSAEERHAAQGRCFTRAPIPNRRIRVGYVSGDYHAHAVSYFVEELFKEHDRTRVEVFAYSANDKQDHISGVLQSLVDHWVPIYDLTDAQVLKRIEADQIDVLIDLSGYTGSNRMGVFARRAAPVQAHYLGYFASTGLSQMDYWIGDAVITPPEVSQHFSEELWRLPGIWVSYRGRPEAPLTQWTPAQDGTVWLGSFNDLGKLAPATMALWANVLHAIPEARLLLKTKKLGNESNRQRLLESMVAHGIGPQRIELQDGSATPDWAQHMAYYDRLDIALDPVGAHGGGTTTCDALWMGVPVITLIGQTMGQRMTSSMLSVMGHPEWIAYSESEYIDKVVALARDVEKRKRLRVAQRSKMVQSPLCDARGLAKSLEDAYTAMLLRWEQNKHAPTLESPSS